MDHFTLGIECLESTLLSRIKRRACGGVRGGGGVEFEGGDKIIERLSKELQLFFSSSLNDILNLYTCVQKTNFYYFNVFKSYFCSTPDTSLVSEQI